MMEAAMSLMEECFHWYGADKQTLTQEVLFEGVCTCGNLIGNIPGRIAARLSNDDPSSRQWGD